MMLERRAAMATLLANRPKDLFVVPGLGSTTWDMASPPATTTATSISGARWAARR